MSKSKTIRIPLFLLKKIEDEMNKKKIKFSDVVIGRLTKSFENRGVYTFRDKKVDVGISKSLIVKELEPFVKNRNIRYKLAERICDVLEKEGLIIWR